MEFMDCTHPTSGSSCRKYLLRAIYLTEACIHSLRACTRHASSKRSFQQRVRSFLVPSWLVSAAVNSCVMRDWHVKLTSAARALQLHQPDHIRLSMLTYVGLASYVPCHVCFVDRCWANSMLTHYTYHIQHDIDPTATMVVRTLIHH